MLFLILAVASAALVSVLMRVSGGRIRHNIGMLAMNYLVCVPLAAAFGGALFPAGSDAMPLAAALGGVNGFLYLAGFLLIQYNTRENGVVLASIFQKLGILVPLVLSVVVYREMPDGMQVVGFALAAAAIFLMNDLSGGVKTGSRWALLGMLLACGMGEAMSKIFQELGLAELEGGFLFVTFLVACVLCLGLMLRKGQGIGWPEAVFGALIAVPNFFSAKFLLGALERLPAVIVYPVFSVGTILTVTLAGVLAFREKLTTRQWLGMGAILAAMVLLNL